jgi:hypothetical protein
MRNVPTNSATPAKPIRMLLKKPRPCLNCALVSACIWALVCTL